MSAVIHCAFAYKYSRKPIDIKWFKGTDPYALISEVCAFVVKLNEDSKFNVAVANIDGDKINLYAEYDKKVIERVSAPLNDESWLGNKIEQFFKDAMGDTEIDIGLKIVFDK